MLKHQLLAGCAVAVISASAVTASPFAPAQAANASVTSPTIRFTEIESNDGAPGDWVELHNTGDAPVDLSDFTFKDNDDSHAYVLPQGSVVAPGAFLVLDELQKGSSAPGFDFGLGKADSARLFDSGGALVDSTSWTAHAATTWGLTDDGAWAETLEPTKGSANVFASPTTAALFLSEVDSQPADWVELVNTGTTPIELAGYELRDNSDDHSWKFPTGAAIAPGEYLVVSETSTGVIGTGTGAFTDAIGIGSADRIRLFTPDGAQLDDTGAWEGHAVIDGDAALATLARCEDGAGAFVLAHPTPGAANSCYTDPGTGPGTDPGIEAPTEAWPGASASRTVDTTRMFLEDSSGLDTELTADGVVLWAVDNGEGRFWKLNAATDGTATFAPGWEQGKRARFQRDAAKPAAKGPDTEGITVAGDGFLYLASERDNGAKGVNQNTVLKIDPSAAGPDVIATQEWDVTSILPAVSANLGIEAVEWVSDADLAGKLFDSNTGAPYSPATYPGHGGGLFFVAVEDGGQVFALALNSDGSATRVAELKPRLAGVMALDWDVVRGGLWAVCDDGCDGASAFFTLNGTDTPDVTRYKRPEGLPNTNNEGFATSPVAPAAVAKSSQTAERPVWWFTDGAKTGALQTGTLFTKTATDGGTETPGTGTPGTGGGAETPGTGTGTGTGTGPGTHGSLAATGGDSLTNSAVLVGALTALLIGGGLLAAAVVRRRSAR
ncbi:MAG: lamin tail domain-containing protein [Leucobacter sp.]